MRFLVVALASIGALLLGGAVSGCRVQAAENEGWPAEDVRTVGPQVEYHLPCRVDESVLKDLRHRFERFFNARKGSDGRLYIDPARKSASGLYTVYIWDLDNRPWVGDVDAGMAKADFEQQVWLVSKESGRARGTIIARTIMNFEFVRTKDLTSLDVTGSGTAGAEKMYTFGIPTHVQRCGYDTAGQLFETGCGGTEYSEFGVEATGIYVAGKGPDVAAQPQSFKNFVASDKPNPFSKGSSSELPHMVVRIEHGGGSSIKLSEVFKTRNHDFFLFLEPPMPGYVPYDDPRIYDPDEMIPLGRYFHIDLQISRGGL
jgi:hypothetical protein